MPERRILGNHGSSSCCYYFLSFFLSFLLLHQEQCEEGYTKEQKGIKILLVSTKNWIHEEEEGANNEGFVTDTLITWTSRSLGAVELDNLHALKELESFQNCIWSVKKSRNGTQIYRRHEITVAHVLFLFYWYNLLLWSHLIGQFYK